MKREFLMLAQDYNPKKHYLGGWFVSEKLDGMRAYWDGGISRNKECSTIPWANTEKDQRSHIATGLWSRYGKVIHAPEWWLDDLPPIPLDGELYAGKNNRQELMSTVKRFDPDGRWHDVIYYVIDSPTYSSVFSDGEIKNTTYKKQFCNILMGSIFDYSRDLIKSRFESRYKALQHMYSGNKYWMILTQEKLPLKTSDCMENIYRRLETVSEEGGEGLICRSDGLWIPERSHNLVKLKKLSDAEGVIVGYTWGKRTNKGSKHLGKMGALIVQLENGRELSLSGFTDEERLMVGIDPLVEGTKYEGKRVSNDYYNSLFPIGNIVTFKYRGLSNENIPQEARYFRTAQV